MWFDCFGLIKSYADRFALLKELRSGSGLWHVRVKTKQIPVFVEYAVEDVQRVAPDWTEVVVKKYQNSHHDLVSVKQTNSPIICSENVVKSQGTEESPVATP